MQKENIVEKQNRHSRMSLSAIPTLDTQSGGDPRLQPSGMTNTINRRHAELVSASSRYDNNKTLKQVQGDGMRGQGDNSIKEEVLNKVPFRVPFRSGFTLIELLVVVLIIGILAAVALPQYQKAVEKTRTTEAIHHLSVIKNAIDVYMLEHGLPSSDTDMLAPGKLDIQIPYSSTATASEVNMWTLPSDFPAYCSSDFCYAAMCNSEYCSIIAARQADNLYVILDGFWPQEGWGHSFYPCSTIGEYLYKTLEPQGYSRMEC